MGSLAIRHLRHATGLSQSDFAALLGVSKFTIQAIEQGRVDVSENVARSAFVATGAIPYILALPDSLGSEALAWTREPYTPRHYGEWQRLTSGDILSGTDGHLFDLLPCFYDAALGAGKLGKFQARLVLALHDVAFDLDIQDAARAIAGERGHATAFERSAAISGRIQ